MSDITQLQAFKDWFGESRFVDAKGNPLLIFRGEGHGNDFTVFDRSKTREEAFFFTQDARVARDYAGGREPRSFYLRAEKVLDLTRETPEAVAFVKEWAKAWDAEGWIERASGEAIDPWDAVESGRLFDYEGDWSCERWRDLQASIEAAGYDGAILPDSHHFGARMHSIIVFRPEQIKSATHNSGVFDVNSPDITDAHAGPAHQDKRRMRP